MKDHEKFKNLKNKYDEHFSENLENKLKCQKRKIQKPKKNKKTKKI